ncbi:protein kinase domain-containing protein [Streptomyces sp. GS7]|uniref:protein kinase domain-containing protein n=1 Tax=Streptomyces sp. GS7 TaxID=2692234 RepID=UPI001318D308|nr:protein kinase [Streptomyces sp. GS7]QHC21017.1 protein kinase [Streptomyces sp. GS7]
MGRDTMLGSRYELVERLGRGGMGTVHRAMDHRLRRTVAVKLMSPELAHHPESRARFQREAHAVAALNHPAVATIHDVGEEPDEEGEGPRPFLVMEYVAGRTLAEVLRTDPLSVAQAITVACEVLDALDHSHQHGIVHRDIKPSNIMLTGPTTIKVLDFGIAKALAEAATRLTGSGVAPGTPAYLSPEQISGVEIDHRADLYAMGCLLYELLTGAPPFQADSPFAVMHHHLFTEPVPLTRLSPQIPPAVAAVVARALRKNPAERFEDAAAMRTALADALGAASAPTMRADTLPTPTPTPAAAHSRSTTALRRLRAALRPSTAGALALIGSLLSLLCAGGDLVGTDHFGEVALAAGLSGLLALPFSPRLSSVVAWGPVAETIAVYSELRRAEDGWDRTYVGVAVLLAVTAALCLAGAARKRDASPYAVIVFWFSATASIWYFLDDLHKLFVFYLLLAVVTLAAAAQEAADRYRRRTADRRAAGEGRRARVGEAPPGRIRRPASHGDRQAADSTSIPA